MRRIRWVDALRKAGGIAIEIKRGGRGGAAGFLTGTGRVPGLPTADAPFKAGLCYAFMALPDGNVRYRQVPNRAAIFESEEFDGELAAWLLSIGYKLVK